MPLRKQGTIIPAAALAAVLGAAIVPSSASAFSWSDLLKPKPAPTAPAPVATTPAPTTPTAPAATTPATTPAPAPSPTTPAATTPAATTPPKATGCTPLPTTKAFSKFGDAADYYPAPGGSFESGGPAWRLTTGAKIVSGNENLGIVGGSKALQLSPGATATSPEFCVDETQPSFRFASKVSSLDGGYVAIVLWRDSAGKITQSQFTASGLGTYYNKQTDWNPSAISPLATKIPLLQSGGKTATVQLMFVGTMKAYGIFVGAKATIDSVMVDPYRRG